MTLVAKLLVVAGPLLLVILTGIAGYTYVHISELSIPIPTTLSLFTVLLPLFSAGSTYLSARQITLLQRRLTPSILLLLALNFLPDTVITTLLFTHLLPTSAFRCSLETQWTNLFRVKDERAIRAIQDAFNCCGLNTVKDRAFPFPVNGKASTCAVVYNRSRSCLADWRGANQGSAGVLVGVVAFLVALKILYITTLLSNRPWTHARWAQPFVRPLVNGTISSEQQEDRRAGMRRLIEESAVEEGYRDEPEEGATVSGTAAQAANNDSEHGPRVEPSGLTEAGQEWRDER